MGSSCYSHPCTTTSFTTHILLDSVELCSYGSHAALSPYRLPGLYTGQNVMWPAVRSLWTDVVSSLPPSSFSVQTSWPIHAAECNVDCSQEPRDPPCLPSEVMTTMLYVTVLLHVAVFILVSGFRRRRSVSRDSCCTVPSRSWPAEIQRWNLECFSQTGGC